MKTRLKLETQRTSNGTLIKCLDLLIRSVLMWLFKATLIGTIHHAPIPLEESDAPILAFLI
jgi:hypothetical protein